MAASSKNVRLLVLVVLFTATSFSCASAFDLASSQGSNGRKSSLESAEEMYTNSYFSGASTAQQEREVREWAANQPNVDLTSGTFSTKPLNTPAPPQVGPASGLFNLKPRNTPAPPAVGPAPGLFNLKPRNTPAPPAVGPAPGLFNRKPRNTPAPPAVGPAPGLFNRKPRNTPAPPAVGPAPGLFNLKPRNTPAPPHGPAPGIDTKTYFSRVSAAQQEREVKKGFNRGGAILIPAGF